MKTFLPALLCVCCLSGCAARTPVPAPTGLMGPGPFSEQFLFVDEYTGEPIAGQEYLIRSESGLELRGVTGKDGKTHRVYTDREEEVTVHLQ